MPAYKLELIGHSGEQDAGFIKRLFKTTFDQGERLLDTGANCADADRSRLNRRAGNIELQLYRKKYESAWGCEIGWSC